MLIAREFTFAAAHRLPSYKGKCENLHGHTYKVRVTVKGEINKEGIAFDFSELKNIVENEIIRFLDHVYLNDIISVPTCENIALWIWEKLKDSLSLYEIRVWESSDTFVILRSG